MTEVATKGDQRRTERPRGGIDVFDALSVRFEVRTGEVDAVRAAIRRWAQDHRDGDIGDLVPAENVNLSTVFLDDDRSDPAVVWYLEVLDDDAPAWRDPVATLRRSSLFEALSGTLTGETTVRADGVDGQQLMVNATHPDRQSWYEDAGCDPIAAPVAGDEVPIEVAIVAVPLRAGAVSWLVARLTRGINWLKRSTPLGGTLRDRTDTLAEERMYSESLLLVPRDDRQVLYYYMETEDMATLYEGFEESTDWATRFSEWFLRRILERPAVMFEPPMESDHEVLVHAVDPERR